MQVLEEPSRLSDVELAVCYRGKERVGEFRDLLFIGLSPQAAPAPDAGDLTAALIPSGTGNDPAGQDLGWHGSAQAIKPQLARKPPAIKIPKSGQQTTTPAYPTTRLWSPETSPEVAYFTSSADLAPSFLAAVSMATAGPKPHMLMSCCITTS